MAQFANSSMLSPSAIPWSLGENHTMGRFCHWPSQGSQGQHNMLVNLRYFPLEIIKTSVLLFLCTPLRGWSLHLTHYWIRIGRLELELQITWKCTSFLPFPHNSTRSQTTPCDCCHPLSSVWHLPPPCNFPLTHTEPSTSTPIISSSPYIFLHLVNFPSHTIS